MRKREWLIGAGGAVVLLAGISGCGGGGEGDAETADATSSPVAATSSASGGGTDTTEFVCDDFAKFIRDGRPDDQRSEVVSGIGDLISGAEQGVRDGYETLTNTVNGPAGAQQIADDTFAQACFDAGWEG